MPLVPQFGTSHMPVCANVTSERCSEHYVWSEWLTTRVIAN